MNRRQFLQSSMVGLAFSSSMRSSIFADDTPKRVGVIGPGWYGKCDLFRLVQVAPVEVVSLCDVNRQTLEQAADLVAQRQASKRRPRLYKDYREMLKEKDLDIVLIDTPDHWHALPMIAAVQAGADVWVQKPISVDVIEGQAMLAAARKYKKVVQVGTQRRSTPHLIEARDEYLRGGKLGKIGLVEIYCYTGSWSRGRRRPEPPMDLQPPDYLDYDMWVGPAPMRPYRDLANNQWRSYWEYGNGLVGDMGIHMLDMVRWMLDLGWPKRISSTGGIIMRKSGPSNTSDTQLATFEFEDLPVVWQHRAWGAPPDPQYWWGATFYGENGTLKASPFAYDFIPSGDGQPVHRDVTLELEQYPEDKTEPRLEHFAAPAIRYHMKDFLAAIASRGKPVADIEEGYISTTCCILANLAMQLGRTLTWDQGKQRVAGDDEANRLLQRPYRKPWVHPDPEKV
ncbi:MAG TPA: Gfo/Idh/MocA family oxidoreductase [Acidobacteriota bacterium]|nr:Gfo/Idh/MocA family oxidoreductase [Acidobacteriota bacterium]